MRDTDPIHFPGNARQPSSAPLGRVISVRGSQVDIEVPAGSSFDAEEARVTVGKFVGIRAGKSLLIGVVTDVSRTTAAAAGPHQ
jgi:hypothetical protein